MLETQYEVDVTLRGIAFLTQMRPWNLVESLKNVLAGKKSGKATQTYDERSLYKDEDGYCCVPFFHIRGCLKNGARYVKLGRKNVLQEVKSMVWLNENMIRIKGSSTKDYLKDKEDIEQNVFPDKLGKQHYVERPMFFIGWEIDFTITCLSADFLNPEKLLECLEVAGLMYGIGAHRPDNGRFAVVRFDVRLKDKKKGVK